MALSFGQVTDEWRIAVADGTDAGREPDIQAPYSVTATFTPLVSVHQRARFEEAARNISFILTPLTFTYEHGVLRGAHGEDGVMLVAELDGIPIAWRVTRTVRPTAGGANVSIPLDPIRLNPGGTVHLPDAASIPPSELPQLEEVRVDVTALEDSVASLGTAVTDLTSRVQEAEATAANAIVVDTTVGTRISIALDSISRALFHALTADRVRVY